MVKIRFTRFGSSSATGNFAPGDLLVCGAEAARHFVEDAQCAEYESAPAPVQASAPPVASVKKSAEKKGSSPAGSTGVGAVQE